MRALVRRHWWWAPVAVVILFFVVNIVRTVRSPSPALARASDRDAARRSVASAAGDRRWPRGAAGDLVVGNGVVEPLGEVIRVAGSAPGRIAAMLVREGDRVQAGQVLAKLDDAAERADLASAEAQREIATAELAKVRRGNRTEVLTAAKAAAARASAQAELSRAAHQRLLKVHRAAEGAVALARLDRALRRAEADAQSLRQAQAERDRVLRGARREDRRVARARLMSAQAGVQHAEVRLRQRGIVAPVAGQVLRVNHRVGEYYTPGEGGPMVELGDTSRLVVRMEVDERDIGRIAEGAAAFVEAPAFPGKRFAASVERLSRRMGRKRVVTTDPGERLDVQVLELVLKLKSYPPLMVGQRVVAFVTPARGR